jgi:N-acyl-D-amino-acid deacylase
MRCDVKLSGGNVIDGTGAPARAADVAISDGSIQAVGDLSDLSTQNEVDCTGCFVVPGFIDIHSHSDWLVPGRDCGTLVEPFIRQGMTSLVGGNCGFSPAPVSELSRSSAQHRRSRGSRGGAKRSDGPAGARIGAKSLLNSDALLLC